MCVCVDLQATHREVAGHLLLLASRVAAHRIAQVTEHTETHCILCGEVRNKGGQALVQCSRPLFRCNGPGAMQKAAVFAGTV